MTEGNDQPMSEEPISHEEQQPGTPQETERAATGDEQAPVEQPAEGAGSATDAGAPTTDETAANNERDASGDRPADTASATGPEEAEAAEKPSADGAAVGPAAGSDIPVSADEVKAAMKEMMEAAESSTDDAERVGAAGAGERATPTGQVEAVAGVMPGAVEPTDRQSEATPAEPPPNAAPFEPPDFSAGAARAAVSQIDLLDDVELDVKIELGRTEMYIEDVLGLGAGSVVELDKAAGDPVDIFVNDRLVARGEVLVLNDSFCVRINDILSPIPELEREQ